jgi:hypothetical protein
MNKVLYAREGAKNMMDNMFDYFPWDVKLVIDGSKITIPQVSLCSSLLCFILMIHMILTGIYPR